MKYEAYYKSAESGEYEITTEAGDYECSIEASSAEEALDIYEESSWIDCLRRECNGETYWLTTTATRENDEDDTADRSIAIDPDEPECSAEEHDWQRPIEIVGGLAENPGVFGHGGGVRILEICANCGIKKRTDTWAQRPDTGEQGLTSIRYEEADEVTIEWLDRNK